MRGWAFVVQSPTCGDGVCNTETCKTCPSDCGQCTYTDCPGSPPCTAHGECVDGACQCVDDWSGPDCSYAGTLPITVITGGGGAEIGVNSSQGNFVISVIGIEEIDSENNIVAQQMLPNNISFKEIIPVTSYNASREFNYSLILPNQANFQLLLHVFLNKSQITFASQTISMAPNSIKYSVLIENWPFQEVKNRLQIITKYTSDSPPKICQKTEQNLGGDNQQWLVLTQDGVSLYGRLLEYGLSDAKIAPIHYSSNDSYVFVTVSHFWESIEIDPDFSVLLNVNHQKTSHTDICGNPLSKKKKVNNGVIIGVVVGVVGAALVVAGAWTVKRELSKRKMQKQLDGFKLQTVPSEDKLQS